MIPVLTSIHSCSGFRKRSFSGTSVGGFTTFCWQTTWRRSSCHTGETSVLLWKNEVVLCAFTTQPYCCKYTSCWKQKQFAEPELGQHRWCRHEQTVCRHFSDADWWQYYEVNQINLITYWPFNYYYYTCIKTILCTKRMPYKHIFVHFPRYFFTAENSTATPL